MADFLFKVESTASRWSTTVTPSSLEGICFFFVFFSLTIDLTMSWDPVQGYSLAFSSAITLRQVSIFIERGLSEDVVGSIGALKTDRTATFVNLLRWNNIDGFDTYIASCQMFSD